MKLHFTAIAGTGMGSVAGLAKESGYIIKGSDEHIYPPMSNVLKNLDIQVFTPFKPQNLDWNPDLVVVGNVCRKDHIEVLEAQKRKIPLTSFPSFLEKNILKSKISVVVAGTHGKTTTTTILSYLLEKSGLNPGYLIGGVPLDLQKNFNLGKGNHFIIEGDEYDTAFFDKVPKFLHYAPQALLLTGIEFDHADIYEDLPSIINEFEKLIKLLPESAPFVGAYSNPHSLRLAHQFKGGESYGLDPKSDWYAENIQYTSSLTTFTLKHKSKTVGIFSHKLIGKHNLENLVGALALSIKLGIQPKTLEEITPYFSGVKRRQEFLGEKNGVKIYDDFGHHPTAIKLTLEGFAKLPHNRLIVAFEPRSATSRRKIFQEDYAKAFEKSNAVFIAPPYDQSRIPESDRFNPQELEKSLNLQGKYAQTFENFANMQTAIENFIKKGDLLVFFSSGSFGNIPHNILKTNLPKS